MCIDTGLARTSLKQDEGSALSVCRLVNRLDPGERAVGDDHRIAVVEHGFRRQGPHPLEKQVDRGVIDPGHARTEIYQLPPRVERIGDQLLPWSLLSRRMKR